MSKWKEFTSGVPTPPYQTSSGEMEDRDLKVDYSVLTSISFSAFNNIYHSDKVKT